jgi:hypothetical protein
MCRKAWCKPISPRGVLGACLRTGAFLAPDTTSSIQADASPRRRLLWWSTRCGTGASGFSGTQAAARQRPPSPARPKWFVWSRPTSRKCLRHSRQPWANLDWVSAILRQRWRLPSGSLNLRKQVNAMLSGCAPWCGSNYQSNSARFSLGTSGAAARFSKQTPSPVKTIRGHSKRVLRPAL